MAYIYIIKNDINDKVYIGKTHSTPQKRFLEHCRDMRRPRCEHRPLYDAMKKHGTDHFYVEMLEETENPDEREQYWIQQYNSYRYGYNATLGGEGKPRVNQDTILQTYQTLQNQKEVAQKLHIDVSTVRKILHEHHVPIVKCPTTRKPVVQLQHHCRIQEFASAGAAARYLIETHITGAKLGTVTNKITDCARHERKSAYGYQWEFT